MGMMKKNSRKMSVFDMLRRDSKNDQESSDFRVLGHFQESYMITQPRIYNSFEVEVVLVVKLKLGGTPLPSFLKASYLGHKLRRLAVAQKYFLRIRRLSEYEDRDAQTIGEIFMIRTQAETDNEKKGVSDRQVSGEEVVGCWGATTLCCLFNRRHRTEISSSF